MVRVPPKVPTIISPLTKHSLQHTQRCPFLNHSLWANQSKKILEVPNKPNGYLFAGSGQWFLFGQLNLEFHHIFSWPFSTARPFMFYHASIWLWLSGAPSYSHFLGFCLRSSSITPFGPNPKESTSLDITSPSGFLLSSRTVFMPRRNWEQNWCFNKETFLVVSSSYFFRGLLPDQYW